MGGFISDILGPSGLDLTGGTSDQTQKPDDLTMQLNRLKFNTLNNIFNTGIGPANALANIGNYASPSPYTSNYANLAANTALQPGLNSQDWYSQALQGLSQYGNQASQSQNLYNQNQGTLSNLLGNNLNTLGGVNANTLGLLNQTSNQNINNLSNINQGNLGILNSLTGSNLNYINNSLAPQLLGSGQDYFRQILSPQINNQNALLGLARSGANAEAQSKGAASIALPIAQQIAGLTGNQLQGLQGLTGNQLGQYQSLLGSQLGQNYQGLANQLGNFQGILGSQLGQGYGAQAANLGANAAQQAGFGQQYLQNLYGLNQQYPNVDIALQQAQLQRLGQGLNFSDYARQQTLAGLQPQLQGYLSTVTGTPYTPGGTSSGQTNTGILGALAPFASGVGTYLAGLGGKG